MATTGCSSDGGDTSREEDLYYRGKKKLNTLVRINKQKKSGTRYNKKRSGNGSRSRDNDNGRKTEETEYERIKRNEIEICE